MHSLFEQVKKHPIVKRRTDILTVVDILDHSSTSANEISASAAKQSDFPHYRPDGAGATLIFHTESNTYVLGGIRCNPALEKELTSDNCLFPQQINSTIGGYLANPELSLREAIIEAVKNKMFLKSKIIEGSPGFEAQQVLMNLCLTLENNEGWEEKVCVHTDKWTNNDSTESTMCYLTAIKHTQCSDADLFRISESLETIMTIKKEEGINPRALSAFKFVPLQPIISNSLATHLNDELTKAQMAYKQFGNVVAVTFNDLAIATLSKSEAFSFGQFAQFSLSGDAIETTVDYTNQVKI